MGRSTSTDIVPFVIHGFEYTSHADFSTDVHQLIDPECAMEDLGLEEIGPLRGWEHCADDGRDVGKRGRLFGHLWRKGTHEVWLVNESQYSNGGDYEIAAVANDQESLKAFLLDWCDGDIDAHTIEQDDTVQLTC